MPHSITLVTTIAPSLGLALTMGLIASRLKLPPIVGYLMPVSCSALLRQVLWRTSARVP